MFFVQRTALGNRLACTEATSSQITAYSLKGGAYLHSYMQEGLPTAGSEEEGEVPIRRTGLLFAKRDLYKISRRLSCL